MSTMGGMTIGRMVTKSSTRRILGNLRWTYVAVGTMSTMVRTVVTAASRRDRKKAAENPTCEGMARTA